VAPSDDALTVRVEDIAGLTTDVVTLACAGDCAEVAAVARGGNPPLPVRVGGRSAERRAHGVPRRVHYAAVSVTDTAIENDEFPYRAHGATAELTARVLACADAGARDDSSVPDAGRGSPCAPGDSVAGDPLGGTVTFFRQGAPVPAGRYRIVSPR
jgi:hypothetical protein